MTDVVDLIMNDHRELERIFGELLDQPRTRPTLVPLMTTLLTAHSRAEEAEVYPRAAEAGGAHDTAHSQQEHLELDRLALNLSTMDPDSDDFSTALQQLIDGVKHHVEEEEKTVLPGMRARLDSTTLITLGDAFLAARAQHLGEQPEDITKEEMVQQASNADIHGASSQSKEQLKQTLSEQAEL